MKHIYSQGGELTLLKYLQTSNPILPSHVKRLKGDEVIKLCFNPFLAHFDETEYQSAVILLNSYVHNKNESILNNWWDSFKLCDVKQKRKKISLLMAIYYTNEISFLLTMQCDNFRNWLCDHYPFDVMQIDNSDFNFGAMIRYIFNWITENRNLSFETKTPAHLDSNLKFHIFLLAIENPHSYLALLLLRPISLRSAYLPGMPGSEFDMVLKASGIIYHDTKQNEI
jgi:hypothetical protein